MPRRIDGLRWAKRAESPWPSPRRARGAKAQGLRYERLVAKALPEAEHGPWFQFEDRNGPGFCSPDFLLEMAGAVVVLECKLTDCYAGWEQLRHLYLPVVALALAKSTQGVVVAKRLQPASNARPTLAQALAQNATLHWLGLGPFPFK